MGDFCDVTINSAITDSVSQCVENPMLFKMWGLNMPMLFNILSDIIKYSPVIK